MFKAKLGKPTVAIPPPPPPPAAMDDSSATYQEVLHTTVAPATGSSRDREQEEVMTEYSCSCTDVTLDEKYCIAHNHTQSVANRSVNKAAAVAAADQGNLLSLGTDATKVREWRNSCFCPQTSKLQLQK